MGINRPRKSTSRSWNPGLLVSVRDAEEARLAVEGGAHLIDVKEPSRGPLGRASVDTWRSVRSAVPVSIPVSVALGELADGEDLLSISGLEYGGIGFRKIGLAGAGLAWQKILSEISVLDRSGPMWIAVAYSDWEIAHAPAPDIVIDWAIDEISCAGVLIDTWDKAVPSSLDLADRWQARAARVRSSGKILSLAGSLDGRAIDRLSPLRPDYFGVRGAACDDSSRLKSVDRRKVASLVEIVARFQGER